MSIDLSAKIAQWAYGKSDKLNAPCNQNEHFRAGYAVGSTKGRACSKTSVSLISEEWERIGCPDTLPDSFKEWKRGYWAGVFQTINLR